MIVSWALKAVLTLTLGTSDDGKMGKQGARVPSKIRIRRSVYSGFVDIISVSVFVVILVEFDKY